MSMNGSYNIIWTGAHPTSANELATVIKEFIGNGLDEEEWKHELEARGWVYDTNIRNAIIHQEFVHFIPEIRRLLAEPNVAQDSSKSNSRTSIFKRIRGEEWIKGVPDERAERLRNRMLYGKVAKLRVFQERIKKFIDETSSESHRSEPKFEDDFNEKMNPATPGRTLTSFPGLTSTSTAHPSNNYSYGLLVPNGCPSTAPFPNNAIYASGQSPANDTTPPELSTDWSSSKGSQMLIGSKHYAYPHTTSLAPSPPLTEAGIQHSMYHGNPHPGAHVPHEFPVMPGQQHQSSFDSNFDLLAHEYNAYCPLENTTQDAIRGDNPDEEMRTDRDEMAYETPYENGINRTLQPRPPQHLMSFDSSTTLATGVQDCFNRHVDSNNIYSEISQPMHGYNTHSQVTPSSNDASPIPGGHVASPRAVFKNDEASIYRPKNNNSCPESDTEMENGTMYQPRSTNATTRLASPTETAEVVILRKIVHEQDEQLRARDAENFEMKNIIKKFLEIQISNKKHIDRIAQNNSLANELLRQAIDNRATHDDAEPRAFSQPNHALPAKPDPGDSLSKAPVSTTHTRNKSTVSSSAGTTTTTSSPAGNLKEVSRQIDDLNSKIKSILKSLKENKSTTHDTKHDELRTTLRMSKNREDFSHDVGRDSGIAMGESPRVSLNPLR